MAKQADPSFWDKHTPKAIIAAMVLVALACVFVVIQLAGLNDTPAWWVHETNDRESAVRLENAITTQLTAVRQPGDERWSVAISEPEINAWLAHRLRPTIETHQGPDAWPAGLGSVRVDINGGRLLVGAMIEHSTGRSFAWSDCTLAIEGDDLLVRFSTPRIGTTRVPTRVLGRVLTNGTTTRVRAMLDLEDGRVARILAVRVHADRVELVIETARK